MGNAEDDIPFFVVRPRGTASAKICFSSRRAAIWPTRTVRSSRALTLDRRLQDTFPSSTSETWKSTSEFIIYGLSTYDYHIDGGEISYSTWRRPLLNMRPKHCQGFGPLWQFRADLDLIDWLESQGYEFDVATDHDLIREGSASLSAITSTHRFSSEYYSTAMVDAWEDYFVHGRPWNV